MSDDNAAVSEQDTTERTWTAVVERWKSIGDAEALAVRRLGDQIGYGRLMQLAEQEWRRKLEAQGLAGGEHTVGPCRATLAERGFETPLQLLDAYDATARQLAATLVLKGDETR